MVNAGTITDLTRLLKICPTIKLTFEDIQKIIDTNSFNSCIADYKNTYVNPPLETIYEVTPKKEKKSKKQEEKPVEEVELCEDPYCDCNSYN